MNQSIHLYHLQKIDSQIDQINSRMSENKHIIATDLSIKNAGDLVILSSIDLDVSRKNLSKIEDEVGSLRIKLEICDSSLYSGKIKNPKELSDLQNEISSIKKHISTLEEKQLELMYAQEIIENTHKTNLINEKNVTDSFISLKARLAGEISQLLSSKSALQSERETVVQSISAENLNTYNNLRPLKKGVAVTTTKEDECTGCGNPLRPAELQFARSTTQLYYCSSCGRIIYVGS